MTAAHIGEVSNWQGRLYDAGTDVLYQKPPITQHRLGGNGQPYPVVPANSELPYAE
jgi:hypothetical protein